MATQSRTTSSVGVRELHNRTGDAIQLASALTIHASESILVLAYDNDLAVASAEAGINVIRTTDA